jgi:hypothetical protein
MDVYEDFHNPNHNPFYPDENYWPNGVYENISERFIGWHDVVIVGYNDSQNCWICKNSWGPGWGLNRDGEANNGDDGGWFKIKYGNCGINYDTKYIKGVESTFPPELYAEGSVDFGRVEPEESLSFVITIYNEGNENTELNWALRLPAINWADMEYSSREGVLSKEDYSTEVLVTFNAPKAPEGSDVEDEDYKFSGFIPVVNKQSKCQQHVSVYLERFNIQVKLQIKKGKERTFSNNILESLIGEFPFLFRFFNLFSLSNIVP